MKMTAAQLAQMQKKLVDDWNKKHPTGTAVILTRDDGTTTKTTTRSAAQLLGGHTAVIWLKGVTGCYVLDRVQPFQACFIHADTEATGTLNVPCAKGGKLHVCTECAKPENRQAVFEAYKASHGKSIAEFKAKAAGREGLN